MKCFVLVPALSISFAALADVSLKSYEGHWRSVVPANYFIFGRTPDVAGSASCQVDFSIKVLGDAFQIVGDDHDVMAKCRVSIPAPVYSVFHVGKTGTITDDAG